MNISPITLKKVAEFVSTFEPAPNPNIESGILKGILRDELRAFSQNKSAEWQTVFYQHALRGLKELQQKLAISDSVTESITDVIEMEIETIEDLLNQLGNPLLQSPPKASLGMRPVLQQNIEEHQQTARNRIAFLGGVNLQGIRIMSEREFKNLVDYTDYLVRHEQLPPKIQPIKSVHISKEDIKYTYYLIHKELYTTSSIKDVFINFLLAVFADFHKGPEFTTIKKTFSRKPKSYDIDVKKIKNDIDDMK